MEIIFFNNYIYAICIFFSGCIYKLGQTSQQTPPLFFNSNNELVLVATGNRPPIVHSVTGTAISSGCQIMRAEVDTGNGWSLLSSGLFELTTVGGTNTYLNVSLK